MTIALPLFRRCLLWMFATSTLLAFGSPVDAQDAAAPIAYRVYIGTYTGKESKGIYQFKFNPADGTLEPLGLAGETVNPSFLAIAPDGRHLYAVGEVSEFEGKKTGGVTAFAIEPKSGKLKTLNVKSSGGAGPCHVVTDAAGKHALVANYGGGSAAVLPIADDGSLKDPSSIQQHEGSGVDPSRQQGPHAHSINLSADGKYAFVADLGLDAIKIYRFDSATGKLTANDPPQVKLAPGAGPRHFAFHPTGKFAFVCNEMLSTVTSMKYDAASGALTVIETLSTLPKDADGKGNSTAEVQVHPSGKFVYVSNRGHNSIASFQFDAASGKLTATGHQVENVNVPRNFAIDPTGKFAIVANQAGNSLVVFRIDETTGKLLPTGQMAEVPSPVCVRYLAWE